MRIRDVRLVDLPRLTTDATGTPEPPDHPDRWHPTPARKKTRAFPIHKYADIPRDMARTPGRSTSRAYVQVIADDGQWGLGPCDWANLAAAVIIDVYRPLLVDRDALAIEYLNDLMWRTSLAFGASGLAAIARSAVDLALWDLKGKALSVPVYSLIGGPSRPTVELYCTTDDLEWAKSLGFRAFKIANPVHYDEGSRGLDAIEAHVAAAREEVGADAELMINPVMSFNVEFAARVAERLRPYDLRWIEEPLPPHDMDGHAALREAFSPTPLATGEHLHGRHAFRQLIDQRGVDVLQPDILWCGGLSEALKIYALGEAAGLITIPHISGSTPFGLHFAAAMPECPMAEYFMASKPGVPLDRAPTPPGTPVPKNGRVTPSDAPGFGYEVSEADLVAWRPAAI